MRAVVIAAVILMHAAAKIDAGAVSAFTFEIASANRVAAKTTSAATFTFTPPSDILVNDDIVIQYPSSFFANGVTPSAALSGGKTCSPTATGATANQVSCLNVNAKINANTVVVLTLTGMTMVGLWVLVFGFGCLVFGFWFWDYLFKYLSESKSERSFCPPPPPPYYLLTTPPLPRAQ